MPRTMWGNLKLSELREELGRLARDAEPGDRRRYQALRESLDALSDAPSTTVSLSSLKAAWKYTSIDVGAVDKDSGAIIHGSKVPADPGLRKSGVNVLLDGFWVQDLPGFGEHEILISWTAHHHVAESQVEAVSFVQHFNVREDDANASIGRPIFLSLKAPMAGIGFEFDLIDMKNNTTERLLKFLDSAPIQSGLQLVTAANPALGVITTMAQGLAHGAASEEPNRYLLKGAYLGLDFQSAPSGVRLREGTYIVAQANQVDWDTWKFENHRVAPRMKGGEAFPFNYFILRIARA